LTKSGCDTLFTSLKQGDDRSKSLGDEGYKEQLFSAMAPVMFTLVSAESHQPVQESHQSLLAVAGFLRWDFPLHAQGNEVDITSSDTTPWDPGTNYNCRGISHQPMEDMIAERDLLRH